MAPLTIPFFHCCDMFHRATLFSCNNKKVYQLAIS